MATRIYKSSNYIIIDDGVTIKEIPSKDCTYDVVGTDYTIIDTIKGFETTSIAFASIQTEAAVAYASQAVFNTFLRTYTGSDVAAETSASENQDPWIKHAKNIIFADDGVAVTLEAANQDLLKFGRNKLVNTTKTTLMTLPVGIDNENYLSTNAITTVISSSASDTEVLTIEGHTVSGGVFTFVIQSATLTGQTAVTLATPLARISRIVNAGSNDLVGNVYGCENDTFTAGVPNTDLGVHIIVEAGLNNSEKAATTLGSLDYWVIEGFYSDCLEKTAAFGTVHIEVREQDKTFINKIDISTSTNVRGEHAFKPYLIVKPNSDIRMRVSANSAGKDFSGGLQGAILTS